MANFIACPDTAIAKNTSIMINRNNHRAIIGATIVGVFRKAGSMRIHAKFFGNGAKLIVAVLPVYYTRNFIINQEKFGKNLDGVFNFVAGCACGNFHALFNGSMASSNQGASANINSAKPAYCNGFHMFAMTKNRDENPRFLCRI